MYVVEYLCHLKGFIIIYKVMTIFENNSSKKVLILSLRFSNGALVSKIINTVRVLIL